MSRIFDRLLLLSTCCLMFTRLGMSTASAAEDFPVVFSTQVPIPADFATIGSTFANHLAGVEHAGRGGDLWVRYTDGALKNLTLAAGYGNAGFQGAKSIAVRDPAVHWDGNKVVFSMALHSAENQYQVDTYYWQLYEISGLTADVTPVINKVANQPENYNNISPVYGTDDRILFTSDRPRKGMAHLYPQLDEYESAETVTGLWSLEPQTGDLFMLTHSPSGDFTPIVDSYGRVIFTRWDHLKRDQQADKDYADGGMSTVNWSDESASAMPAVDRDSGKEVFPEPINNDTGLLEGSNLQGHNINHFFPWMVNEDGSALETLNHIGRHELHQYFDKSLNDDENLQEFIARADATNQNPIANLFHIQEDPLRPGYYIGVDAPEFATHSSGQIVELRMPPGMNPDLTDVTYLTPRSTETVTDTPESDHTGHYRDPLPLSNGRMIAAHTPRTDAAANVGDRSNPLANLNFRLTYLRDVNGVLLPGELLTSGITKSINYWDPDVKVSYSGELWELHPVELRPRVRPVAPVVEMAVPELTAFKNAGVDPVEFRAWLKANDLALVVSRNVTRRDSADKQQPFNLKISGSNTQSIGATGKVYEVAHLQFFQGDLVRGYGGVMQPGQGRRVLAQPMHDGHGFNPVNSDGQSGSVKLGQDGSMAALVPARRALSWQMTDAAGTSVVRERVWLSFSPGEVRVCASCHGVNTTDQFGSAEPTNKPEALVDLLKHWSGNSTSSVNAVSVNTGSANQVAAAGGGGVLGLISTLAMLMALMFRRRHHRILRGGSLVLLHRPCVT